MPYVVRPIDMQDVPALSEMMMRAFWDDPHWALVWPGMTVEEVIEGHNHRLPYNLITGREKFRYQKAIDTDSGEIVGYSRWLLPSKIQRNEKQEPGFWKGAMIQEPTPEQRKAIEAEWKSTTINGRTVGLNQDMVSTLSRRLEQEDTRVKNGEEFIELDRIATARAHQNKGIGTLLMQSGLEQADAARVNVLVMASTVQGQKLYEKCGFKYISTITQDDSKWGGSATGSVNHWYMRRKF